MSEALTRLDELIAKLEAARGSRVLVLHWQDQHPARKSIEADDALPLYACLQALGRVPRLDVVLEASGGSVTGAYKLATLLGAAADRLTFLVPYRARSAATLLALVGQEIVLGPLGELGPLDPRSISAGPTPAGAPPVVSAEELRSFPDMARNWFGVTGDEAGLRQLEILCARIFPTALVGLYRADLQMRRLAGRLIAHHLPHSSDQQRAAVVDRLVTGYSGHDEIIDSAEATAAGLNAVPPDTSAEARLLWEIREAAAEHLYPNLRQPAANEPQQMRTALMLCREMLAEHVALVTPFVAEPGGGPQLMPAPTSAGWRLADRA